MLRSIHTRSGRRFSTERHELITCLSGFICLAPSVAYSFPISLDLFDELRSRSAVHRIIRASLTSVGLSFPTARRLTTLYFLVIPNVYDNYRLPVGRVMLINMMMNNFHFIFLLLEEFIVSNFGNNFSIKK